jgi:hypothetical protein
MRQIYTTIAVVVAAAGIAAAAATYQTVSFSTISNYEYELPDPLDPSSKAPQNVIPAAVKALNGKMVALEGFMLPLDLTPDGVSVFMLNASLDMCYFGAPVRMNEWVLVKMKAGKRAKFTHLATTVKGRFEVGEEMRNGRVASLYRLEADLAEVEDGR